MGSFLGEEKIGTLSHNAGIITLQPSTVLVGGRMVRTGALTRTIATDVTLTANTLYFVYVQIIGGTSVLRISLSSPSVYKISNPTSALVGAFQSNALGSVSFGSFLNITGTPRSGEIDTTISGSGWSFTPIAGKNKYLRDGKYMDFVWRFGVASPAASLAQINLPANITTSSSYSTDSAVANPVGVLGTQFFGELAFLSAKPNSAFLTMNLFRLGVYQSGVSANANGLGSGDLVATGRVAIEQWDNTPLKDL